MKVKLLTPAQAQMLIGQTFHEESLFNPILDANDNWIISLEETSQCDNEAFLWVKDLPEIDFEPKPFVM